MLRSVILAASRSKPLEHVVEFAPPTRAVVRRFVAGSTTEDAVRITRQLVRAGLSVSVDYLGEDTTEPDHAAAVVAEYRTLLATLAEAEMVKDAEVSVKLSALGQHLDAVRAVAHAAEICRVARDVGTTVTLDMESHRSTDATLAALRELRRDFPDVGAVLQAQLRRTEADCRDLAQRGSRVRLCKGAYSEPESVAYREDRQVDRSYVRCANVLLAGEGHPMFATHDPRLLAIVSDRANAYRRDARSYEFQMLYGVRPDEQRRIAEAGYAMRVYVPYGTQWYGYLMRRLAERPANVMFFLRALASRR